MTTCRQRYLLSAMIISALLSACGADDATRDAAEAAADAAPADGAAVAASVIADIDGARIAAADSEPGNWMSHGRTYDEQRFSPLTQINADNVGELGLAWYWDTDTRRGLEATPIVVDGIMYSTGSWSVVWANDARTGELLWEYDPAVPRDWGKFACCDVVNRGVAAWKGRIYVGTLDGRWFLYNLTGFRL